MKSVRVVSLAAALCIAAAVAVVVFCLAPPAAEAGIITVPLDYRADTDAKIVGLKNYNALDSVVTSSGLFESPWGSVIFETGGDDVPVGWTLWFLDSGDQPVGYVVTTLAAYNFPSKLALVFGDDPDTTGVDEGATMNTFIGVVAKNPSDQFFEAHFATSLQFTDGENPIQREIHVTSTEIIPEPATLVLLAAGATLTLLRRRRVT